MLRIGFLTSGGDCQALNAAMRGVVKVIQNNCEEPYELYGFENGYNGLIYGKFRMLTGHDFSGILTIGGTILGTSRVPFKTIDVPDENGLNKVEAMKQNYYKLQLDCLVMLGGNGSTKTANRLSEEGLNIITLPKTIDNDLWGTDMTFGFQSAVDIATTAIAQIHTTASSHGRVFIVEIMGHKVGWLPLNAGIAGGADIILIPEIPYDIDKVCEAIEERDKRGSRFTIIVVAEGAISKKDAKLSKKEYAKKLEKSKFPSVSYEIADKIAQKTGSPRHGPRPRPARRRPGSVRPRLCEPPRRGSRQDDPEEGIRLHGRLQEPRDDEGPAEGSRGQAQGGRPEVHDHQGSEAPGNQIRRLILNTWQTPITWRCIESTVP